MLNPIINNKRRKYDISGLWKFRVDEKNIGIQNNWQINLTDTVDIAVPGSWNEQLETEGLIHYTGTAWYSQKFLFLMMLKGIKYG